MSFRKVLFLFGLLGLMSVLAACNLGESVSVGGTGDTASDTSAAQRFVPTNIPGYIATDARSITDALTNVGAGASLITGNPLLSGALLQIDNMIACYQSVGAVAARVYVQADVTALMQGDIPSAGAFAVVNQDRVANNFLPCALSGGAQQLSAQAGAFQPCGSSGQFVVNGETLLYVYGATTQQLCQTFQSYIPVS